MCPPDASDSVDEPLIRSGELLSRATSRLLVIDVQQKLVPLIPNASRLIALCRRLVEAAQILGVPVYATEQYPQGLGATVIELAEVLGKRPAKLRFSCVETLDWGVASGQGGERFQVVVVGIEAHVCILQTVLDLLAQGYQVFVAADAVGSRGELDCTLALDRMAGAGAIITTSESVMFEWCEVAGTPEFKKISQMLKGG